MSLVAFFFSSASHPTTMIHHQSMTEGLSPLKATYLCLCVQLYVCILQLICSRKLLWELVRPRHACIHHYCLLFDIVQFVLGYKSARQSSRGSHILGYLVTINSLTVQFAYYPPPVWYLKPNRLRYSPDISPCIVILKSIQIRDGVLVSYCEIYFVHPAQMQRDLVH